MKAWLKGGLIIGITLFIISWIFIFIYFNKTVNDITTGLNEKRFICSKIIEGSVCSFNQFITYPLYWIISFIVLIIGFIIGSIIGKVKSKREIQ